MSDLKPCPFCGSERVNVAEIVGDFFAVCGNCGAQGTRRFSMEINNEFRRDVAAVLRLLDVSYIGDDDNIVDSPEQSGILFNRILEIANDYRPGLHYFPSHFVARDAVELFADIIEPEPERTCKVRQSYFDSDNELNEIMEGIAFSPEDTVACICEACGHAWRYDRGIRPNYCPQCGAKVIE